jgi:uncharacterized membrane protein YphA (DoxX/SURF4 family)
MTSAFLLGRIIFGGYWIMSGVNHFTHLRTMVDYVKTRRVPFPEVAVAGSGVVLVCGGLSMLLGFCPTAESLLLVAFLLAASFMIHKYWEMDTVHARQDEKINFDKNMALVGALLMFVQLPHPWPHSLGM